MARIPDSNKMDMVKQSLLDIIVQEGTSHATISKMAKRAGVSSGYLYRHYDSKDSLLEDLYNEKFNDITRMLIDEIEHSENLQDAFSAFYTAIVKLAKSNENEILFFFKMMTEYSMKIPENLRNKLTENVDMIKSKYQNELNDNITAEQLFTQLVGSILIFINIRKRGAFSTSEISDNDITALTRMAINALK